MGEHKAMRELFVTPFDTNTKLCTGPSIPLPAGSEADAAKMMGTLPNIHTKNTMIFNQPNGQALCVSWIRFSL